MPRMRLRLTSGWIAGLLLVGLLVPVATAPFASTHSPLPRGVFDDGDDGDDDDDDAVATLPDLTVKLLAPIPSLMPELPPLVQVPALAQTDHSVPFGSLLSAPSRSPPLL